jgi:hypothetical protein
LRCFGYFSFDRLAFAQQSQSTGREIISSF